MRAPPLTDSVTTGLARSGWIVSMAAVILSVSFIQLFGIGSDLAVLIDATLIRGILVPAAFRLMGRWTWWSPAPLRTFHTRIGLTESTPGSSPRARSRVGVRSGRLTE